MDSVPLLAVVPGPLLEAIRRTNAQTFSSRRSAGPAVAPTPCQVAWVSAREGSAAVCQHVRGADRTLVASEGII